MLKKKLFLGLIILIVVNFNYVSAETLLIIPLKKPSQTKEETQKKLLIDVLKPLPKPIKIT